MSRIYQSQVSISTCNTVADEPFFVPSVPPTSQAPPASTASTQRPSFPGSTTLPADIPAPGRFPSLAPTRSETPLAAVRTVDTGFTPFIRPVASSLSASNQRQIAAARHRVPAGGTSTFARSRSNGPSAGPATAKPSRNSAKTTAATVVPSRLKCAIIPFAVCHHVLMAIFILLTNLRLQNKTERKTDPDSSPHPSNMFRFSVTQRNELLYHLAKHDLVIEVERPNESETAWEALDNQITHHLQANNIGFQPPKEVTEYRYLNTWWRICHPSRTNKPGISNYLPHIPSAYDFTFEYLQSKVAWRHPIEQGYSVFFVGQSISITYPTSRSIKAPQSAPVKNNLRGPSPDANDPKLHPCWPWRVVTPLHDWLEIDEDYQPNPCISECSDSDSASPENHLSEASSMAHADDEVSWVFACNFV